MSRVEFQNAIGHEHFREERADRTLESKKMYLLRITGKQTLPLYTEALAKLVETKCCILSATDRTL